MGIGDMDFQGPMQFRDSGMKKYLSSEASVSKWEYRESAIGTADANV